jgi:hypothetical protein
MLSILVRHAREYNAKAKPIERLFGTLCSRFSKLWPTYCGSSPEGRPADLGDKLKRNLAPPLDEFVAAFGDWLDADYHHRAHGGHGMNGRTPREVYEATLISKRVVDPRLLDSLTMRRLPPQKVGRNGVTVGGLAYGRGDLAAYFGRTVVVAIDDRSVGAGVQVYDLDGKLICVARANARIPFLADRDEVQAAIAEIRRDKRCVREAHQSRMRMHDSLPDRLYRRAAKQRTAMRNQPPPSLVPVRTGLDGQLPAIRRGFEHVAVGAESMSLSAYAPTDAAGDDEQSSLGDITCYLSIRPEERDE